MEKVEIVKWVSMMAHGTGGRLLYITRELNTRSEVHGHSGRTAGTLRKCWHGGTVAGIRHGLQAYKQK